MTARPHARTRGLAAAIGAALLVAVLGGCTGIPDSSKPQRIEQVQRDQGVVASSAAPPKPGLGPLQLVQSFLLASGGSQAQSSTTAYLTGAARAHWAPTTVTVIDGETVGNVVDGRDVQVTGRVIGTIDDTGVYTPSLQGIGDGGIEQEFPFVVTKVAATGQNRISSVPSDGLIITLAQFNANYSSPVTLYFYDSANRYLVPDLRWTALTSDPAQEATWLVNQLLAGPSPQLKSAVSTDPLPPQVGRSRVSVRLGALTTVEIPGSSQLSPANLNQLAAQLAATLNGVVPGDLTITDGGTPVRVPAFASTRFPPGIPKYATPPTLPANVYYLLNGRVIQGDAKPLPGPLGSGAYALSSIAVAQLTRTSALTFAGVALSKGRSRLYVGLQYGELHPTSVVGTLSRPAWAPGQREVWVGDGPALYRVITNGVSASAAQVSMPAVSGNGQILAVRISPEGSRIAMVIAGSQPGSAQIYVGSIVRTAGQARIAGLQQVSPEGVSITDVGWVDQSQLYAIGHYTGSADSRTCEVEVDGSDWSSDVIPDLPGHPDALAFPDSSDHFGWVSVKGTVYEQGIGSSWMAPTPGPDGQTLGTAPVYLE